MLKDAKIKDLQNRLFGKESEKNSPLKSEKGFRDLARHLVDVPGNHVAGTAEEPAPLRFHLDLLPVALDDTPVHSKPLPLGTRVAEVPIGHPSARPVFRRVYSSRSDWLGTEEAGCDSPD